MEEGVTEVQSLLPPHDLNPEDESKREDDKEKEDGFVTTGKVEKVKKEYHIGDGGGVIKNLISSLVTPLSPKTGKASTEHENGNGVFELEEGTAASRSDDHGERGSGPGVDNGVEGGLISNLISNFFNQSEGEGVVENKEDKEEEEVTVEKIKRVTTEKEANDGGGGIIHNIVSHFPTSLPAMPLFSSDDAAPTTDEATILLNSIVRD